MKEPVKDRIQTLARNESERDSAARVGQPFEEGEALHRNPLRSWRPMCQYRMIVITTVESRYSQGEKGIVHVLFIESFLFF